MLSTGLPCIPGYSSYTVRPHKILTRTRALFNPPDPPGKPTYLKFLNEKDIFKNKNAPILKFYASFDDRGEPARDRWRFRDCHVLYFVEDGMIKVYEPKQRNSGMDQDIIISKNLIPKPDGGYYSLEDLNIGETLILYGKSFKLVDCDPFTKNFLREMGYRVKTPEPPPVDPVTADRFEEDIHRLTTRKPFPKDRSGEQFLKNFPRSLHFYGIYKRTDMQFEEKCYVSLYYQLYDGRIKIIDDKKISEHQVWPVKGVQKSHIILKPMHLPKKFEIRTFDEIGRGRTILNLSATIRDTRFKRLFMSNKDKGGFLPDSNPLKDDPKTEYYKPEDLDLGNTIDVFGASVFLYDCDEYTKQFYKYEFDKVLVPVPLPDLELSRHHKLVYPQKFGSPIDTLCGWKEESLKGHTTFISSYDTSSKTTNRANGSKVLLKFHLNCRDGCDGKTLRFLSRILTDHYIKKQNMYLIAFYLEDDTIEITKLSSDLTHRYKFGDTYLRRMKVVKPTTNPLNSNNCFYQKTDFFIGSVICVNTEQFYLFDADEYTLDFMSRHSNEFPHSNLAILVNKFREFLREKACSLQTMFEAADTINSGEISYNDFSSIIRQHIPKEESIVIPEQELITLARCSCSEDYIGFQFEDLVSKIQFELKRQGFQDFDKLKEQFEMFDLKYGNRTGFFPTAHVYEILLSCPLKIHKDLLKFFVFKFPKKDGLIDYRKVVECLDYIKNPSKKPDHTPYSIYLNWSEVEKVKNIARINYRSFLKNIVREDCPECEF
ncbi:EF-hand domain-containing family member C2-like [Argiope bruennichi]|uniref:EF-hand domain-containing family member C2-like n=1 Tax=Argiope bruennichi TaxID=94029 RepID=UPI00249447E5|nr:EF-hand domain-containing family member C2-like [Argiope bruennichi]